MDQTMTWEEGRKELLRHARGLAKCYFPGTKIPDADTETLLQIYDQLRREVVKLKYN